MKTLKYFVAILTTVMSLFGFAKLGSVHAETGTLTHGTSSHSGQMTFRHAAATLDTYEDFMILRMDGKAVFCVDPTTYAYAGSYTGTVLKTGDTLNRRTVIDEALQAKLERIAYFGYNSNPTDRNYHFTQALIWETLGWALQDINGTLTVDDYYSWKQGVLASVDSYNRVVSFNGESYALKVGESITLTDTNGVLQNLNVEGEQNGFSVVKDGNTLTITATENAKAGTLWWAASFDANVHGSSILYLKEGSQTVASLKLGDPQYGEVTISSVAQPVLNPEITTTATTEVGEKVGFAYEKHTEIATLTNLKVGQEYRAVATQYDETGKVYASKERIFKATSTREVIEFLFEVPVGFVGNIVYGEDLYQDGNKVATHYDLTNKDQTVTVKQPKIETVATTENSSKEGYAFEKHVETAELKDLIVGRQYKVVATQYDETGKVYATQERTFVAKATENVESFTFEVPTGFVGKIVYGEDLYFNGNKVAYHYDLTNDKQTVTVKNPEIGTTAKVGGNTQITVGEKQVVTDTLNYNDFKQEEVMIRTWIVKYGTDEKVSEVFERIVKLDGNGQVVVSLDSFDTSKLPAGKYTLMEQVFEVKDGKPTNNLVSQHVDNKDDKQTITVVEKPKPGTPVTPNEDLPNTSSVDNQSGSVALAISAIAGAFVVGRKRNED